MTPTCVPASKDSQCLSAGPSPVCQSSLYGEPQTGHSNLDMSPEVPNKKIITPLSSNSLPSLTTVVTVLISVMNLVIVTHCEKIYKWGKIVSHKLRMIRHKMTCQSHTSWLSKKFFILPYILPPSKNSASVGEIKQTCLVLSVCSSNHR